MGVDGVSIRPFEQANIHDSASSSINGSFNSHSVDVSTPSSSLADCAEELTFVKDNSKKTKLEDRKQKKQQDNIQEQIEKLKQVVKLTDNSDNEILRRLVRKWRDDKSSEDSILKDLGNLGHKASSLYAELLNLADDAQDDDIKTKLLTTADKIYAENKSEIQASLNALLVSPPDFDLKGTLALSYGEITVKESTPLSIVQDLQAKYGAENIDKGLDFMLKALSCDLSCINPSQDSVALESVGSNLSRARHVGSALKGFDSMLDRFANIHGIADVKSRLNAALALESLLKVDSQKFITTIAIRDIYKDIKGDNPEIDVLLAQELLHTLRDLPIEIYESVESRSRVIDASRSLIDDLVDKEEQWINSGE